MSSPLASLAAHTYVSLETFRADGSAVRTPVWIAGCEGALWVVTDGTSFKVKRLRANPACRIAPCNASGARILGDWHDATATIVPPADAPEAVKALRKKYGLQFALLDVFSRIGGRYPRRALLRLVEPQA